MREWIPKIIGGAAVVTAAVCVYFGTFMSAWNAVTGTDPLSDKIVTVALMIALTVPAVVFGMFGVLLWREVTRRNAKVVIGGFAFFLWAYSARFISDVLPWPEKLDNAIPSFIAVLLSIAAYAIVTAALLRSSGKPIRDWSDLLGPVCAFFVSIEVWSFGSRVADYMGKRLSIDDLGLLGFFWHIGPIIIAVLLYKAWMRWLRSTYPSPAVSQAT